MKIVNASSEIIVPVNAMNHIEVCGRICYKSENKITSESSAKFIQSIIRKNHESVLEHCRIVINSDYIIEDLNLLLGKRRSFFTVTNEGRLLISANIRAWRDLIKCRGIPVKWLNTFYFYYHEFFFDFENEITDQSLILNPENHFYGHLKEYYKNEIELSSHYPMTVHFITNRNVTHDLVRHRIMSFSQESTRWCNYSLGKFGNEITFVSPCYYKRNPDKFFKWVLNMDRAEKDYLEAINSGDTPEEASGYLPHFVKAEIVITDTLNNWKLFFDKRLFEKTGKVRRNVIEITRPLFDRVRYLFKPVFNEQDQEYSNSGKKLEHATDLKIFPVPEICYEIIKNPDNSINDIIAI